MEEEREEGERRGKGRERGGGRGGREEGDRSEQGEIPTGSNLSLEFVVPAVTKAA